MLECKHVLPFFHQRAVCRPYICKYGIYGIVTYPRQGKRTETTLPQIRDFPHEVLQTEEKCAFD